MSFILTINTAFETASVILSKGEELLFELQSSSQKDHASFLEPAIKTVCAQADISLAGVDAISVISGPGSYTGLRVGLSSAKALCYALKKQLILLNTLDVMALALKKQSADTSTNVLYCPLIDARRMEVFTALYNSDLSLIKEYTAEVLDTSFLEQEITEYSIIVGGNGGIKLEKILHKEKIIYVNPLVLSQPSLILGYRSFLNKQFANVVYSEPFYLKPVHFKK